VFGTSGETLIFFWALIWVAGIAVIVFKTSKKTSASSGLVLAYLFNFWLLHWPGAVAYLSSSSQALDLNIVESGFRLSTYGMVSFVVGSVFLAPRVVNLFKLRQPKSAPAISEMKAAQAFVIVGIVFYLGMGSALFLLPTVRALISSGWQFVVVGFALMLWKAWHEKKLKRVWTILALTLSIPVFTLITLGYVSYGVAAMLAVFAFTIMFYRPRKKLVLVGLAVAYLGFSFYVGYMKERTTIREAVWGGQDYSVRAERMVSIFTTFEFFNPLNPEHLQPIDDRLNQNLLVGASVNYMDTGLAEFARGSTMVDAVEALMPRILWPDKPITAGSTNLVSNYTGMSFGENTSVGIGQVLEFYINFGEIGIVIGFLIFGVIVTVIDQIAIHHLMNGNWRGFTLWYLPGLAFLQAGGQLVEITAGAASAAAVAFAVTRVLQVYYRPRYGDPVEVPAALHRALPAVRMEPPVQNSLESGGD